MSSWTSWPQWLEKLAPLSGRSSQQKNINRRHLPSFVLTHSSCSQQEREVVVRQKEGSISCLSFTLHWLSSMLRKFCRVFSLVVSHRKISMFLCSYVFVHVVLSVIFQWLIVLRYHLSKFGKTLTWYHSHLERRHYTRVCCS